MGLLCTLKENKKTRRDFINMVDNEDYVIAKQILIDKINLGGFLNYSFVDWQIIKVNLPKEYCEEISDALKNAPWSISKILFYFSVESGLQRRLKEK